MGTSLRNPELVLRSVNRRLAGLLHEDPLPLATGGVQSLGDSLWVWGVVGGKNVGKSTLINALAGDEVVDRGDEAGEGTSRPAAYLTAVDLAALRMRFAELGSMPVDYHPKAPLPMRGLVLVDLPDFDSLYAEHVETVQRISGVLDGIIWVTTPKKLGDVRAIEEIRRVLKARANFVHVVNKMDWLLGQAKEPAVRELDRTSAALRAQVAQCDSDGEADRSFLIAAKYGSAEAILRAIAQSRNADGAPAPVNGNVADNGDVAEAAAALERDFNTLRTTLVTAPTAEAAEANKRANLDYQVKSQAADLLDHYQPRRVLDRLRRAVDGDATGELVDRFFPGGYCGRVMHRLNSDRSLFAEWSSMLFRKRIANWSLLGIIAWPVMTLGALLGSLRSVVPVRRSLMGSLSGHTDDPFRLDGVSLEDRTSGLLGGVRARLGGLADRVCIELVPEADLADQFRSDLQGQIEAYRAAAIAPYLALKPGILGGLWRWLLPVAIVLWFPLVQPVLAGVLGSLADGGGFDAASILVMVGALSAGKVLAGLCVSLLLLAMLVAAVYSRAVRDTLAAIEALQQASTPEVTVRAAVTEPLQASLIATITRPVEAVTAELTEVIATLDGLGSGNPA